MGRFGFCDKWRSWIKACVFSGKYSVLVNCRPTKEVSIQKGLKQGHPLAPFLFLLVAENLRMKNAILQRKFKGFKVGNSGTEISILQYADDTMLVCEACWENLWVMKSVLRCFKLVSGLKVNFKKTRVIGINVEDSFVDLAADFFNCRSGALPFRYLGLPVGANLRSILTWKPIIVSMEKPLVRWKGRHLSFGGRVTLINSVLNRLPIYFLSFLRIPKNVLKILIPIKREFLSGGAGDKRKIA